MGGEGEGARPAVEEGGASRTSSRQQLPSPKGGDCQLGGGASFWLTGLPSSSRLAPQQGEGSNHASSPGKGGHRSGHGPGASPPWQASVPGGRYEIRKAGLAAAVIGTAGTAAWLSGLRQLAAGFGLLPAACLPPPHPPLLTDHLHLPPPAGCIAAHAHSPPPNAPSPHREMMPATGWARPELRPGWGAAARKSPSKNQGDIRRPRRGGWVKGAERGAGSAGRPKGRRPTLSLSLSASASAGWESSYSPPLTRE